MTTEEKIFNAARTVFQKRVFRARMADEGHKQACCIIILKTNNFFEAVFMNASTSCPNQCSFLILMHPF
jgi:hypothetical protein